MKKQVHISLFLLLWGCAQESSWAFQAIPTTDDFYFTKLISKDSDFSSLELEFFSNTDKIDAFLSLKTGSISGSIKTLSIYTDDKKIDETAFVLKGGMKLKLSDQATQFIIESLLEGKKIDILLDGFSKRLEPDQFAKNYLKLEKR